MLVRRWTLLIVVALWITVGIGSGTLAHAGPVRPDSARVLGRPDALRAYWHDQRWIEGDFYACALYAQASVLEALGYDFRAELDAAKTQGQRDGWFDPVEGTVGLGQPLRARGVAFAVYGTSHADTLTPDRALARLQLELLAGHWPIANLDAQQIAYYRGSAIRWHTIWITGMHLDDQGLPAAVIANDSTRGAGVSIPVDEFMRAWADFNYYAIFVAP